MKTINSIILALVAVAVAMSLTSCDPFSSVEFNVHNMTSDTVAVTFHSAIVTSPYQGYDIVENDSVTTHYENDSNLVAILIPGQHLTISREWDGLYRDDQVVPAWKYITAIKIGDTELDPTRWNNESSWHLKTDGGGRFTEKESRYYDLYLRNK